MRFQKNSRSIYNQALRKIKNQRLRLCTNIWKGWKQKVSVKILNTLISTHKSNILNLSKANKP